MFYVTHELVVQRREDHGIYEDLNPHLLTLTQLAEESTALTVCPFGQKYVSHTYEADADADARRKTQGADADATQRNVTTL